LDLTTRWDIWLDEDGRTTGQPMNTFATSLADQHGIFAPLHGTVVVTGADRESGHAAPLTPEQITTIPQCIAAAPKPPP
jgi:Domain of unknown function (DUF3846)